MEEKLLVSRTRDARRTAEYDGEPAFFGFLSPSEQAVCERELGGCGYEFFGGYEGAERTFLCCKPDWCDEPDYPIAPLTFRYRKCDTLSHRDFLGALMALGITRASVGDILVEKGRAVVFVARSIAPFVVSQLRLVGRVGVEISEDFDSPLPELSKTVEVSGTVASCRLDCIVAEIIGVSRSRALDIIEQAIVSVNSVAVTKSTHTVREGDRITVRGKGRFTVLSLSDVTKKGRTVLKYTKFIQEA